MNPAEFQIYKNKLLRLQAELDAAIADEEGQTATVHLDGSMGRLSRNDALQSQQMAMALQRRQQEQLLRVETALKRIEQGTYGRCLRCKGDIGEGRLDMQPEATLCVTCASRTRT